jgi:hypothetical protein
MSMWMKKRTSWYFARQGAMIIMGKELDRLSGSAPLADPTQPVAPRPQPRFLVSRQLQLYPANVEIRILALKGKARTAGDVIVYYPAEKADAREHLDFAIREFREMKMQPSLDRALNLISDL